MPYRSFSFAIPITTIAIVCPDQRHTMLPPSRVIQDLTATARARRFLGGRALAVAVEQEHAAWVACCAAYGGMRNLYIWVTWNLQISI